MANIESTDGELTDLIAELQRLAGARGNKQDKNTLNKASAWIQSFLQSTKEPKEVPAAPQPETIKAKWDRFFRADDGEC
jgi:hypothetical protein